MYKYIKGSKIVSNERFYSGVEIAKQYCLWMPFDYELIPNGELIETIIATYIKEHNLKVSDYYYMNDGHAFQVFSKDIYVPIMEGFIGYLESNNIVMSRESIYELGSVKFIYYKNTEDKCKILDFKEYKKRFKDKGENQNE